MEELCGRSGVVEWPESSIAPVSDLLVYLDLLEGKFYEQHPHIRAYNMRHSRSHLGGTCSGRYELEQVVR